MSSDPTAPTEKPSQPAASSARTRSKSGWVLVIGLLLCIAGSVYYIYRSTKEKRDESGLTRSERVARDLKKEEERHEKMRATMKNAFQRRSGTFGSIENPEMVAAAEAELDDDAQVIGVGEVELARAYSISRLARRDAHVVHDKIGETPVTITYCDITDEVRIFHRDIDS